MGQEPERPASWTDSDREAFWAFVRVRMAELRLKQEAVARAISMHRTLLSRRLNGETRERPSEQTVADLASVLKLSPEARERLLLLAGYGRSGGIIAPAADEGHNEPANLPIDVSDGTAGSDGSHRRSTLRHRTLAVGAGIVGVLLLIAAAVGAWRALTASGSVTDRRTPTPAARVRTPGGVWVGPQNGDLIHGPIAFAARAYATDPGDAAVATVFFTVSWDGRAGPWLVACRVATPMNGDRYECTWDPATVNAPAGPLHISFDVYDAATPTAHVNMAPHGTRTIIYAPFAP